MSSCSSITSSRLSRSELSPFPAKPRSARNQPKRDRLREVPSLADEYLSVVSAMVLRAFSSVSGALGAIGIRNAEILQYVPLEIFHLFRLCIFEMIEAKEMQNAVNGQVGKVI